MKISMKSAFLLIKIFNNGLLINNLLFSEISMNSQPLCPKYQALCICKW